MINSVDYVDKIIMAPMVRVGTLPMRLLALEYGADLVYTEEIIDWKLLKTTRRVNDVLGTIDYIDQTDGSPVFRTCSLERHKVILQIGTASAERALAVAKMIEKDVAAIDINMGCPKEFSIKGGMGVALLYNEEKAVNILETLVKNVSIPITCKIRILPDLNDTIALVKRLESTGIRAIAIHGRTKFERPQHMVKTDIIKQIAEHISIPVIANGGSKEIEKYCDILKFREACGASSVMIARAAEWNCSIFRKNGMLPLEEVIIAYLKLAVDYDNSAHNTKYCVQNMLRELQESVTGRRFLDSQTMEQLCEVWDLGEYCRDKQLYYQQKGIHGRRQVHPDNLTDEDPSAKRQKVDEVLETIQNYNIAFIRSNFTKDPDLPKSKLYLYSVKQFKSAPKYEIERKDKLFRAILSFDNQKYTSSYWEKNKKCAEQGAALVCLLALGLEDKADLIRNGSLI